jgi:hypothetical protein
MIRRAVDRKWLAVLVGVVTAGCSNGSPTPSDPGLSADRGPDERPFTIAVIGDTPYGDVKMAEFQSLVALINADPAVERVLHAGDIKAGKNSDCSSAYFHVIRGFFDTFDDPLVYTPGDNEWTDCHVEIKNNGLYTPTERLLAVRDTFFPVPGQTLGSHKRSVESQASDPANAAYVENVMWSRSDMVFAALSITGSNNDVAPWGSTLPADAGNYPSQTTEQATRAAANAA